MTDKKYLIDRIDALLPQTQCQQCGYTGCRPYAEAIAQGEADINQCPPGDEEGIQKLAKLLGVEAKPLDTSFGFPKPKASAFIDENACIGCTLCLRACPVDAIVGVAKHMHTVITAECTGCELCIAPCPMDCIRMVPAQETNWHDPQVKEQAAKQARMRHQFRLQRLAREQEHQAKKLAQKNLPNNRPRQTATPEEMRKKAIIQAALKRAAAVRKATVHKKTGSI